MDQISAKRYLYYFIKNKISIFDLEQWLYNTDEYKDILKRDNLKYLNYMNGIRREVIRLLGFFEKKGIMIEEEYEYIDKRADKDRIELHSIDKMLNT